MWVEVWAVAATVWALYEAWARGRAEANLVWERGLTRMRVEAAREPRPLAPNEAPTEGTLVYACGPEGVYRARIKYEAEAKPAQEPASAPQALVRCPRVG